MLKQVLTLSRIQLKNLFGINEMRYTKDKKKKLTFLGLAFCYLLIILVVFAYIGSMSYALHFLGMGEIVPMYLYTILSLVMLILSFFKAGSILFSMKSYDIMVSLPVTKSAILISRFVTMYVTNLLFAILVMLPGIAVHIWFAKPGISFYLISIPVILFAPLLPLTISSILGALIKGISSRMKKKSLVETLLTIALVVAFMLGGVSMGEEAETMDLEAIRELLGVITTELGGIFPPALWYHNALHGKSVQFLLLLGLPTLIFFLFVWLLSKKFQEICTGLNATYAKHNYELKELKAEHILISLFKKEAKMYFSSSLYVTNTIIGYVLALLLAGAVGFMGIEPLAEYLGAASYAPLVRQILPFVFTLPLCMTSATSCAISMEGKTFWQLQVLPVKARDVYNGKLLWNLALASPFYVVSVVLLLIGAKPDVATALHYVIIPPIFLLFTSVLGLASNLRFPVLNWDTEARVVKQSAAVLVSMLVSIVAILVPTVLPLGLQLNSYTLYYFAVEGIFLIITAILYSLISRKELITVPK